MVTTPDWNVLVRVGHIVRPHGIRGAVVVAGDTDFGADRFSKGAPLWWLEAGQPARAIVTSGRSLGAEDDGRWVVSFEGVEDANGAETLRGRELRIAAEDRAPLPDGQFYLDDLIGCEVVTTDGERVGPVSRLYEGAQAVLGIEGPRGEVLVPFVDVIVKAVDPAGRRIEIAPPPGLLEANEPTR